MGFWDSKVLEEAEKEQGTFEVLPEGIYTSLIVDCAIKATKTGGHYINIKHEITGPSLAGRVIFDKLNIDNSNSQAVSIGMGQLHNICKIAGTKGEAFYDNLKTSATWNDAENMLNQLHSVISNIPLEIKVSVQKSEQYGDQNSIKRIKSASNSSPVIGQSSTKSKNKSPFD